MDWNVRLQAILDLVEVRLQRDEAPMDEWEIARLAGCSYGFFQKVFSYMNHISFAEYVRLRKLTLAGYDLKSTDLKVVEISYKYGYDSPTSFTKAFRQFHGVSPSEARRHGAALKVFPKMQVTDRPQYVWRLEHKPALRLVGKSVRLPGKDGAASQVIPAFWSQCQRDGSFANLVAMDAGDPPGALGLFPAPADGAPLEYALMVISGAPVSPGWLETTLPAGVWAVFDCRGPVPAAIQQGWHFLQQEWLARYPFRHAPCPEVEWYSDGNPYGDAYLSQIWIPISEEEL